MVLGVHTHKHACVYKKVISRNQAMLVCCRHALAWERHTPAWIYKLELNYSYILNLIQEYVAIVRKQVVLYLFP